MTNATTIDQHDQRTLSCPSWCATDHRAEWADASDTDRRLCDVPAVCRTTGAGCEDPGPVVRVERFDRDSAKVVLSEGPEELSPAEARSLAVLLLEAAALCEEGA